MKEAAVVMATVRKPAAGDPDKSTAGGPQHPADVAQHAGRVAAKVRISLAKLISQVTKIPNAPGGETGEEAAEAPLLVSPHHWEARLLVWQVWSGCFSLLLL